MAARAVPTKAGEAMTMGAKVPQVLVDMLGWGIALWLVGYALGIALFLELPAPAIGWAIMPVGIAFTLWVLIARVKSTRLSYYVALATAWTAVALVGDYLFIVKAFARPDGYYKLDVYVYYALTFVLPLAVGQLKARARG